MVSITFLAMALCLFSLVLNAILVTICVKLYTEIVKEDLDDFR